MHKLLSFILLFFPITASFAADTPASAVVTKSQITSHEVTKSVRTNGCRLELWRYNKSNPYFQGHWIQHVYAGDQHLLQIEHSLSEKEQYLAIDQNTGYGVVQIDRHLDGKYDLIIVISLKDQVLEDVLIVTDDGWLRHGTPEEFQTRQHIFEGNRQAVQKLNKDLNNAAEKVMKDSNEDLNK